MNCKNCGAVMPEVTSFCSKCGQDLRESQQLTMKIVIPKKIKMSHKLMNKLSEIISLIKMRLSKITKAFHKLVKRFSQIIHLKSIELYKKIKQMFNSAKRFTKSIKEIVIMDGWTWVTEDDYTYIRGSVKNIGKKAIKYFEVNVKYKDSNKNVLDSDFTNWDRLIQPGDAKEFEIKHYVNKKYQSIDITINKYK